MPPLKMKSKKALPAESRSTPTVAKAAAVKALKPKPADLVFQKARRSSILLKHLSDPTRLQVVALLSAGEMHVGALSEQLSQSQPSVSHHLALLRHGGVIMPRRRGKNNFYSLTETGVVLSAVLKMLTT